MYTGSDLDTLLTALATFVSDGFLEYDFNIGQKIPYLSITVSDAQIAIMPLLPLIPPGSQIINLYYTMDFTPAVADFITAFQDGVKAAIDANASVISSIDAQISNWSSFKTTYNSKG